MTNQMPSGSENAELTQAKGTFTRLQVISGFAFIGYLIWSINSVIQNPPVQTGLQLTQYWIIRSIGLILLPIFMLLRDHQALLVQALLQMVEVVAQLVILQMAVVVVVPVLPILEDLVGMVVAMLQQQ
jgi:hypothetical protein